ncbi:MAG: GMC family oxidoreductase N-terminal domain-containing protein [Actinobacteria bacterium]|nr:GMC family oxidoreductase N-terminal domain-containing protein [Actinomycetota bacterium]
MERAYDAIVVGSGFGGGIAACRLAEQGLSVCLLERGRRFGPGDYPDRLAQFPHALWHPRHNPGGMFDVRIMRDVAVVTGAGVGGGSLVYANVQLRAPDAIFDEPAWPKAIDGAELDRFYARTEEALEPRVTPPQPPLPKVAAFDRMAHNAGRTALRLPIAVHFGADRRHPFSGVFQQGCDNLGRCDVGCPRASKNTIDITYIARAETFGAAVFPLHEVRRIDPPGRRGEDWRVGFRDLQYKTAGEVRAPLLVLAAGTLGTTRLLLRNRRRLRALSPALGSRYSGNGDALALALDPTATGVAGARAEFGPVMTSRIDYMVERGHMVADGGLPASFGEVLEVLRGVRLLTGLGRLRVAAKNVATKAGFSDHALAPADMHVRRRAPIGDSLVFLCIGRDAADGRMRLTRLGRFDIRFDIARSEPLFDSMRATVRELCEAAGATAFFALDAGPLGKYVTVHPLGGCPMSDDPRTGVVDDAGKVHGYAGLYILDGSIVPTAIGVNPSKTIAALAERGAERLLAERAR